MIQLNLTPQIQNHKEKHYSTEHRQNTSNLTTILPITAHIMSTAFFGMYKNKNNYKKGQNQCDIVDLRLYVEAASERLTRQSLQQYNCFANHPYISNHLYLYYKQNKYVSIVSILIVWLVSSKSRHNRRVSMLIGWIETPQRSYSAWNIAIYKKWVRHMCMYKCVLVLLFKLMHSLRSITT